MKRSTRVLATAAVGVLTVSTLLIGLSASSSQPGKTATPGAAKLEFTGPGGKPLDKNKVTLGNGFNYLPTTYFNDDLGGVPDDDLVAYTIKVAMRDPEKLQQWQLCPEELDAVADDMQARAANIGRFPQDKPFNKSDEGQRLEDVGWAMRDYEQYRSASSYAGGVSCVGKQPYDQAHTITFKVVVDGKTRPLVIPDYAVVTTPVEYNLLVGNCVDKLQQRLEKVQKAPIDTTVKKGPPWATFSERDKADSVSWLGIEIKQMTKLGYLHCTTPTADPHTVTI